MDASPSSGRRYSSRVRLPLCPSPTVSPCDPCRRWRERFGEEPPPDKPPIEGPPFEEPDVLEVDVASVLDDDRPPDGDGRPVELPVDPPF
jgi:hypothetical protein